MDDLERHRSAVDRYWPRIDRFFDGLPGELHGHGVLFRQRMAMELSTTGDFHDIARRSDDHPVLCWHRWVLDDLGAAGDRSGIEAALFAAAFHAFAFSVIHQDGAPIGLADAHTREAYRALATVIPFASPFWEAHRRVSDDAWRHTPAKTGDRFGPLGLSALAAAYAVGAEDDQEAVDEVLTHLNGVLAIRHDLLAIRRDLAVGVVTKPVADMIAAAGLTADDAAEPDVVLGAVLLTGAIDAVAASWTGHLDTAATTASQNGLATFERYSAHLRISMAVLQDGFRVTGTVRGRKPPMRFAPPAPDLASVLEVAQRYLLADPDFSDAWEVHRWGMGGASEVTARFPAGLVIEVLGKHGLDVSDLVDDFYHAAAGRDFAYYDHPGLPYRETDTVGTMLRLFTYTKKTDWHRQTLDQLIADVAAHALSDGRLPVWLVDEEPPVPLLGEGCGAIEVNLLRGLLAYDPQGRRSLIDRSAGRLIDDFTTRGIAISVNYPGPFLLAAMAAFLAERADDAAANVLDRAITAASHGTDVTPQTAACLVLASRAHPATVDPLDPEWITLLCETQSFDGSWPAEPLFFAPNRDRPTWYRSRLITSALCYDALATVARSG